MPTQNQRDALNDIWKSLEKTSNLIAEAAEMNIALADRTLRLRIIPGDISSAALGVLRQKLNQLSDKLDKCVSEMEYSLTRSEEI